MPKATVAELTIAEGDVARMDEANARRVLKSFAGLPRTLKPLLLKR